MALCYKDMTFCRFHSRCKAGDYCTRSLTDQVQKDAQAFGMPIAQFAEKPNCFDPKDNSDDARIPQEEEPRAAK